MGRFFAQTSLQARTRNAMFATVDTNRKIGIGRRALMSTMVTLPAGASANALACQHFSERQVCFIGGYAARWVTFLEANSCEYLLCSYLSALSAMG